MLPALPNTSPFVSLAPGIIPMSGIPVSPFVQPDGGYPSPSNPPPTTTAPAKLRRLSSPAGFVNLARDEMSNYLGGVGNDCDWSAVDRAKTFEMSQAPDDACHDVSRRTSSTSGFSEMMDSTAAISKHSNGFEDGKSGFCSNDARKAGEGVNDMETLEGLRGCGDAGFGNETVLMETDDNVNSSFTRLNLNRLNCDVVQPGFNCTSQSFGLQRPTLPLSAVFQYQRILPVDSHVYSTPHRF